MILWTIYGIFLILFVTKFYKNKTLFQQLSIREWVQYIVVFFFAWCMAALVIISGTALINAIEVVWVRYLAFIIVILVALQMAGLLMNKLVPRKLRAFYK